MVHGRSLCQTLLGSRDHLRDQTLHGHTDHGHLQSFLYLDLLQIGVVEELEEASPSLALSCECLQDRLPNVVA